MTWQRGAAVGILAIAVASGWVYAYLRPKPVEAPVQPSTIPPPPTLERTQLWHGRVTKVWNSFRPGMRQWLVEYPGWNGFQQREDVDRMWFWVRPDTVTVRRTGEKSELAVGQRVSILWSGKVFITNPPQCHADRVVIEPDDLPLAQP